MMHIRLFLLCVVYATPLLCSMLFSNYIWQVMTAKYITFVTYNSIRISWVISQFTIKNPFAVNVLSSVYLYSRRELSYCHYVHSFSSLNFTRQYIFSTPHNYAYELIQIIIVTDSRCLIASWLLRMIRNLRSHLLRYLENCNLYINNYKIIN